MLKKIDHVALVVKDIREAVQNYTDMFGFQVVEENEGPGGEFTGVMIENGSIRIELFQPLKPGSFMKFLEERGGGLHHVSFATDDIRAEMQNLKSQGKRLMSDEPMELPGAKVVF
ncbi:MAG: VOC family protein, partial [Dehalococcoidales bacterium]|nr:VOC family protein [Dehalococcoidales bacterium]